jgi:hypothetical protein
MIEMIEIGGFSVTREWADAQTSTEAAARHYLGIAEENIRRGYFPSGHETESGFIRAKYPELATA